MFTPRLILPIFLTLALTPALAAQHDDHAHAQCQAETPAAIPEGVLRVLPINLPSPRVPSLAVMTDITECNVDAPPSSWSGPLPTFSHKDPHFLISIPIDSGTTLHAAGPALGSLNRAGQILHARLEPFPDMAAKPFQDLSLNAYPFLLAVHADGSSVGILADTLNDCTIDLSACSPDASKPGTLVFKIRQNPAPIVFILGSTPQEVLTRFAAIIGKPELPPRKALGYSEQLDALTAADPLATARIIRDQHLPCDALWLGLDATNSTKVFSLDPSRFPDPRAIFAELKSQHFSCFAQISPAVKDEPGFWVRDQLVNSKFTLATSPKEAKPLQITLDQNNYVLPDFSRPQVRQWWASLVKELTDQGIAGLGLASVQGTIPDQTALKGGQWLAHGSLPPANGYAYANAYPLLASHATYDGLVSARSGLRPALFSDHGFIGSQRAAITCIPDRRGAQEFVNQLLNISLSGQPLVCADVALMRDNSLPTRMGVGAFVGLVRGSSAPQPPYALDQAHENAFKAALQQRYRLMPYIAGLVEEACSTGLPVTRPLFFLDPADPKLRNESRAFLLGNDIAVVLDPEQADEILPASRGQWERIDLVPRNPDVQLPALFIRPGAIVPVGPILTHVDQPHDGPILLLMNLDKDGQAIGNVYDDEFDSLDYHTGKYRLTSYQATRTGKKIELKPIETRGEYAQVIRDFTAVVLADGFGTPIKGIAGMSLTFDISKRTPVKLDGVGLIGADPLPPREPKTRQP